MARMKLVLLLPLMCLLNACMREELVHVEYLQQARRQVSVRTKNISVVSGKAATAEAKEVMDLVSGGIERTLIEDPDWKVVDVEGSKLRNELIRKALEESIALNDEQLLQLGHELNVALLLTPDIHTRLEVRREVEGRRVRLGTGKWRSVDVNGTKIPMEESREEIVEDVWEARVLTVSGRVRLIDVESGEVLATVEVPGETKSSRVLVEEGARSWWGSIWHWSATAMGLVDEPVRVHPTIASEAEEFLDRAVTRAVNEIAQVKISIDSVLYDNSDMEAAVRLARAGRWRQAADEWEELLAEDSRNAACLHNLGVAFIALEDLEQSSIYLAEAISLDDSKHTIRLLRRVDELRAVTAEKSTP